MEIMYMQPFSKHSRSLVLLLKQWDLKGVSLVSSPHCIMDQVVEDHRSFPLFGWSENSSYRGSFNHAIQGIGTRMQICYCRDNHLLVVFIWKNSSLAHCCLQDSNVEDSCFRCQMLNCKWMSDGKSSEIAYLVLWTVRDLLAMGHHGRFSRQWSLDWM